VSSLPELPEALGGEPFLAVLFCEPHLEEVVGVLHGGFAVLAEVEGGAHQALVPDAHDGRGQAGLAVGVLVHGRAFIREGLEEVPALQLRLQVGKQNLHSFVDLCRNYRANHMLEHSEPAPAVVAFLRRLGGGLAVRSVSAPATMFVPFSAVAFFLFVGLLLGLLRFSWSFDELELLFFVLVGWLDGGETHLEEGLVAVELVGGAHVFVRGQRDGVAVLVDVGECVAGRLELELLLNEEGERLKAAVSTVDLDG
jgi:hypothetical protein